jgi:hypothetical protein
VVESATELDRNRAHQHAFAPQFVSPRRESLPAFFFIPWDFIEQIAAMRVIEILTVMTRRPFLILGKIRSRIRRIPIPWRK